MTRDEIISHMISLESWAEGFGYVPPVNDTFWLWKLAGGQVKRRGIDYEPRVADFYNKGYINW